MKLDLEEVANRRGQRRVMEVVSPAVGDACRRGGHPRVSAYVYCRRNPLLLSVIRRCS